MRKLEIPRINDSLMDNPTYQRAHPFEALSYKDSLKHDGSSNASTYSFAGSGGSD
jgi:hypothetical protein